MIVSNLVAYENWTRSFHVYDSVLCQVRAIISICTKYLLIVQCACCCGCSFNILFLLFFSCFSHDRFDSGSWLFLGDNEALFLHFLTVITQLEWTVLKVLLVALEGLNELVCLQSSHQHFHLIKRENLAKSNEPVCVSCSNLCQVGIATVVLIAKVEVNLTCGLIR